MNGEKAFNWLIALLTAAVYLAVSAAFDAWAYSWAIWWVYAVYRLMTKRPNADRRGDLT